MALSKKWILLGILLLAICFVAVAGAQRNRSPSEFIYDVVVVQMPPPSTLTDNRSNHVRLASELTSLLNANAVDGWQPDQMWGTGPVYVVLKRPKN